MKKRNVATLKILQVIEKNNGEIKQSVLVDSLLSEYKDRNNARASISSILTRLQKEGLIEKRLISNEDSGGIPMNLIILKK